jgi:DNA-directed RNA polymerase II subunit RPB1
MLIYLIRQLKKSLTEEVVRELLADAHAQAEIEQEWEQLKEDRDSLRQIFPSGDSKIVLPCNLQRMIWNAHKIFKIDKRKTCEIHPLKIIEGESFVFIFGEWQNNFLT